MSGSPGRIVESCPWTCMDSPEPVNTLDTQDPNLERGLTL